MVLEEYEHAKARGATIYAELVGFGMVQMQSCGQHLTWMAPPVDVGGTAQCEFHSSEVQYLNAHGTSTPFG